MRFIPCLLFVVFCLFGMGQSFASPPLPPQKIITSDDWKDKPKELEDNANRLSAERKKIEKSIQSLEADLKKQALAVQRTEKDLKDITEQVERSERTLDEQQAALEDEKQKIASLIISLVKMNSIPLDTLMLLPEEKSEDLIVSYQTLSHMHPMLSERVERLEKQINDLQFQKTKLQKEKDLKRSKAISLEDKRQDVASLVAKRQKDHQQASAAYKAAQKRAKIASETAKSLSDLINTVKKKNKVALNKLDVDQIRPSQGPNERTASAASQKKAVASARQKNVSYNTTGSKRLPVSGDITVLYGANDSIGAKSEGIHIHTVPGAIVVAPKAGTIKYSGEFLKYGRIILVEHGKNYHSLIAGLDKIDTVVGQRVAEGDPIANVKNSVYYELRQNGRPVNPLTHLGRL